MKGGLGWRGVSQGVKSTKEWHGKSKPKSSSPLRFHSLLFHSMFGPPPMWFRNRNRSFLSTLISRNSSIPGGFTIRRITMVRNDLFNSFTNFEHYYRVMAPRNMWASQWNGIDSMSYSPVYPQQLRNEPFNSLQSRLPNKPRTLSLSFREQNKELDPNQSRNLLERETGTLSLPWCFIEHVWFRRSLNEIKYRLWIPWRIKSLRIFFLLSLGVS
jgi:hypothetical protein